MSRTPMMPLLLIAAALAACGSDDRDRAAERPAATAAATGPERYCALVRELDAAGEEHFASLGRDATPEEYEAAERTFVEANAARLDEVGAAAPPEIDADVDLLLAAQRERAGLEVANAPGKKAASAAERRIKRFEKRHC